MPTMLLLVGAIREKHRGHGPLLQTSRVAGILSGPRLPCFTFPRYTAGTGA